MGNEEFWSALDELVGESEVEIDRTRGSTHPRHPNLRYPLDYGYLRGTRAGDGGGIDVWVGSLPEKTPTAVVLTVDVAKRDGEMKVLLACTEEEIVQVLAVHQVGAQSGLLVRR